MKPNTLVLGFYDSCVPPDCFLLDPAFLQAGAAEPSGVAPAGLGAHFPPVRGAGVPKALSAAEYVAILADAVKMQKNLCLARYFPQLERERLVACRAAGWFVDVWPLNLLHPEVPAAVDVCSLFLLQLACILTMVSSWRAARLRLFLPLRAAERGRAAEEKLQQLLQKLRIRATIQAVAWEPGRPGGEGSAGAPPVPDEDLAALNALLLAPGGQVAVRFLYLPRPPADAALYERYLAQLELLTRGLGPTLLVHGLTPVTCTEL